jgi:hypothetical protein
MFIRIKVLYRSIIYAIKKAYVYEIAIHELGKHTYQMKVNPWIEYIASRSPMTYQDAIAMYDFYGRLPIVFSRKKAKVFSNLVIEMAGCGYSISGIKAGLLIAVRGKAKK